MTIQLKLTVEWIDSRLEFVNLKNKQEMNTLTPEELDQIWMPTLVFSNTQNKQLAYFRNNSITTVQPNEGHYKLSNFDSEQLMARITFMLITLFYVTF